MGLFRRSVITVMSVVHIVSSLHISYYCFIFAWHWTSSVALDLSLSVDVLFLQKASFLPAPEGASGP